jgi:ribosome-associated protein
MLEYKISSEYIELVKLLKVMGFAPTGGHAKIMVESGEIIRNGKPELRKRAKLKPGEIIEVEGQKITIK